MAITIIRATIIYVFVILAVRIMGRRQVGELTNHEFVITILISSVATVPLEDNEITLSNSLLPILVFISFEIIVSAISLKSARFRDIFQGKPIIIIKNKKLNTEAMRRLRLTVDDVLDGLREKDIFDISEVENAVIETNGKLSVQKSSSGTIMPIPVIVDGEIIEEYFGKEKVSKNEIRLFLAKNGAVLDDTMLMTLDENGRAYIIGKDKSE